MRGTEIDWRSVASDLAQEHVARLAVDTSLLRAQLEVERENTQVVRAALVAMTEERDQLLTQLAGPEEKRG